MIARRQGIRCREGVVRDGDTGFAHDGANNTQLCGADVDVVAGDFGKDLQCWNTQHFTRCHLQVRRPGDVDHMHLVGGDGRLHASESQVCGETKGSWESEDARHETHRVNESWGGSIACVIEHELLLVGSGCVDGASPAVG